MVNEVSNIGVLALQGGYEAHARMLMRLGHQATEVRDPADLSELDGLILPGGESTTHLKLMARFELEAPLQAFARSQKPILATCAGMILAAREVQSPQQRSLDLLDITVERNGWGRQLDSFEAQADDSDIPLCFIRAPRVLRVGIDVKTRLTFRGEPILVQSGNIFAGSFHPELTDSTAIHQAVFGPNAQAMQRLLFEQNRHFA